jgi:uncharacterized protein (DUF58 family)
MTTGGLDPSVIARLGALPLRAKVIVDAALSGLHRARMHGSSVEFAEHKEYSPGDEIRRIDWRTYAKQDRYYIRQYEQESQLTVYLVLDASASMSFQSGAMSKLEFAGHLLAAIAHLAISQNDRVGLLSCGDQAIDTLVPARARASHLASIHTVIEQIMKGGGRGSENASSALVRIAELCRRQKALIILASDLFDSSGQTRATLRQLRAQKHDVAVLHLIDPYERSFPYEGLTRFDALEGNAQLLANPAAIRPQYFEKMEAFLALCQEELTAAGVDYTLMSTDRPLEATLLQFLVSRSHVGVRGGGGARIDASGGQ